MPDIKPENPPAFPSDITLGQARFIQYGITIRDYFAAAAMQGMITRTASYGDCPEKMAPYAYKYADAMLAERSK